VQELRPRRVRLLLDWAALQPRRDRPADLRAPRDGCLRGLAPCAPYAGVGEQLEAAASLERHGHEVEVAVVVHGVPEWAARGPSGCERAEDTPRSRPLAPDGRAAYGELVRDVTALARRAGARLRWWSPWNEPNHPRFVSPQRAACDPGSPALAPAVYAGLVRTARAALPEGVGLVLGELAGYDEPTAHTSGVEEFVAALPRDVACAPGAVWAVHQFAGPRGTRSSRSADAVRTLRSALGRRPCSRDAPIWVTETGAGALRPGRARAGTEAELAASCRGFARALARWAADPRIQGVFQYTVREDPLHPVGLADPGLTRVYPVARLLAAWARTAPGEAPPGPQTCG